MSVSREVQNIESIRKAFDAGKTISGLASEGYFDTTLEYPSHRQFSEYKNCEHCGSRIKDEENIAKKKEVLAEYRKENTRLHNLFREALCEYHGLDISDKKVQKALSLAWERGHSCGYHEVANEFYDLVDLLY